MVRLGPSRSAIRVHRACRRRTLGATATSRAERPCPIRHRRMELWRTRAGRLTRPGQCIQLTTVNHDGGPNAPRPLATQPNAGEASVRRAGIDAEHDGRIQPAGRTGPTAIGPDRTER